MFRDERAHLLLTNLHLLKPVFARPHLAATTMEAARRFVWQLVSKWKRQSKLKRLDKSSGRRCAANECRGSLKKGCRGSRLAAAQLESATSEQPDQWPPSVHAGRAQLRRPFAEPDSGCRSTDSERATPSHLILSHCSCPHLLLAIPFFACTMASLHRWRRPSGSQS